MGTGRNSVKCGGGAQAAQAGLPQGAGRADPPRVSRGCVAANQVHAFAGVHVGALMHRHGCVDSRPNVPWAQGPRSRRARGKTRHGLCTHARGPRARLEPRLRAAGCALGAGARGARGAACKACMRPAVGSGLAPSKSATGAMVASWGSSSAQTKWCGGAAQLQESRQPAGGRAVRARAGRARARGRGAGRSPRARPRARPPVRIPPGRCEDAAAGGQTNTLHAAAPVGGKRWWFVCVSVGPECPQCWRALRARGAPSSRHDH